MFQHSDTRIVVSAPAGAHPDSRDVEMVERTGRGHPDSICDELAEAGHRLTEHAARQVHGAHVRVAVTTANDVEAGRLYLTVTGTSAESGDDGQAGRGNRVGGLITPWRPRRLKPL